MYCWSSADWCTAGSLLIYVLLVLVWLMHSSAGPLLTDVTLVLCCLLYFCLYADCCTPAPLLTDVLLVLCWPMYLYCRSSADLQYVRVLLILCWLIDAHCTVLQFSANWCMAGTLLTDVQFSCSYATDILLIFCCLMYCWSSAACCPASLLLTDAMCVLCTEITCIFTEFSVKKQQMYYNVYWIFSNNIFRWNARKYQQKILNYFFRVNKCTF